MKTTSRLNPLQTLTDELETFRREGLHRRLRTLKNFDGIRGKLDGRAVLFFCSNDYLGLSHHPALIRAFQEAAEKWGVGSGASRLISGSSELHETLETRLARFKQKERALVFPTGYLANLGTISALCEAGDLVVVDKLNHASIIDACKLSGATIRVYPHQDLAYLEKILKQSARFNRKLIITDSVFSMDGDLAALPDLVELKKRYDAWLMIDEAHGTGVFGPNGRGVAEHFGVENEIDISMGTLSKAIGTFGGFVAGSHELIDYLVNRSRPFIFSTAPAPAICAASLAALDLIERAATLRKTLWRHVDYVRQNLPRIKIPAAPAPCPIIPIPVGDENRALAASEALLARGVFIPAVRYPTVPRKKARLRLTVSAAHTQENLNLLLDKLAELG